MLYSLSEPTKSVVGVKTSPRMRRNGRKETKCKLIIFNCIELQILTSVIFKSWDGKLHSILYIINLKQCPILDYDKIDCRYFSVWRHQAFYKLKKQLYIFQGLIAFFSVAKLFMHMTGKESKIMKILLYLFQFTLFKFAMLMKRRLQ